MRMEPVYHCENDINRGILNNDHADVNPSKLNNYTQDMNSI
ncbi:5343_t:CDS:1, partial [Racocetra persica]